MDRKISLGIALGVALGIAAPGLAQQAVQWRVEDGGNGHWYQVVIRAQSWQACRADAIASGGELASITSPGEQQFVVALALSVPQAFVQEWGPFLGGFQDSQTVGFFEPAGGWRWSDGEAWSYSAWRSGEPNNCMCTSSGCAGEDFIQLFADGQWNDIGPSPLICGGLWIANGFISEWSADCNGDGIVDYGQILDGTLEDVDSNGVPDICEIDPCPGDINDSGVVNGIDLAAILAYWGTDGGKFPRTDANNDGTVDANDLAIVLSGWGNCP